jgi:hypothetical protein
MKTNTKALRVVALVALAASSAFLFGCQSSEDKARIRLAVSAFDRAADARSGDARIESLMIDLQKAVDAVHDDHARTEILDCYTLLRIYRSRQQIIAIAYEQNLLDTGHWKNTTAAEADKAMTEAKVANPLPDLKPLSDCEVVRLANLPSN